MPPSDSDSQMQRLQAKIRDHRPCSGYGYVIKGGKKERCECRTEALYKYRLSRSGIPPKYRSKGFKDYVYKQSDAFKQVQDYLKKAQEYREQGIGLFLHGPSYTGKSLLACSLLMELMQKDYECKFTFFGGIIQSKDAAEEAFAKDYDFLCVDGTTEVLNSLTNFKAGMLTGEQMHGGVEFVVRILTQRIHESRPLIMTSTTPVSVINEKFPTLATALLGNCISIACEDKGFRKKQLEQMME